MIAVATPRSRSLGWTFSLGAGLLLAAVLPAGAAITSTEDLDATRTEAWAMRWFTAVATPTGVGVAAATEPGSFEIGLEGGSIPSLSRSDRQVGFNGTKVEDLNRAPVFGRPVVRVGMPGNFSLSAGWVPPVDVDGVSANLLSFAVARPLWIGNRSRIGAQLFYLDGKVEGDITCTRSDVAAADDPVGNPFGCEERSSDALSIRSWGLELGYAWSVAAEVELFLNGNWQNLESEFDVHANYSGVEDRSQLTFDGGQWGLSAGAGWKATDRVHLSGELFYSPLDVIRDPSGQGPSENSALFNVRLMATYRLR
ncbi:MAG: hypothetical protein ABI639_08275 [Thermoanaerobaculia bacterium]